MSPYYIIGFADYVFIGSTLSDGIPVTLPSGNKRLEYDICVSECLKGNLVKKITAVYPAYYENDGTLVLMEGDTMKDDGLCFTCQSERTASSVQPTQESTSGKLRSAEVM